MGPDPTRSWGGWEWGPDVVLQNSTSPAPPRHRPRLTGASVLHHDDGAEEHKDLHLALGQERRREREAPSGRYGRRAREWPPPATGEQLPPRMAQRRGPAGPAALPAPCLPWSRGCPCTDEHCSPPHQGRGISMGLLAPSQRAGPGRAASPSRSRRGSHPRAARAARGRPAAPCARAGRRRRAARTAGSTGGRASGIARARPTAAPAKAPPPPSCPARRPMANRAAALPVRRHTSEEGREERPITRLGLSVS